MENIYFIQSIFVDFIDVIIDNTKTYIQNESKDQQSMQRSQNVTQSLTQLTRPSGHPERT
jgi:hypothetical protein